jgi:hypothetical protein
MNGNDVVKVLETVMSAPGMSELVKVDFKISRKNALLLTTVIEHGLTGNGAENPLLGSLSKEAKEEIKAIGEDWLQKAGLKELSDNLKLLSSAK